MHALIHHSITDSAKWQKASENIMTLMAQQKLPRGLKPLQYLPSVDGRKAACVWEADSMDSLKQFIDRETGAAARNDYFEVKTSDAIGLPTGNAPSPMQMQHA